MKKIVLMVLMLLGIGLVMHDTLIAQGKKVEPKGDDVWTYLQKVDYKTWKLWPGTEAFSKGQPPHGALLVTYVNEVAYKAIEGKAGSLPDGSLIVMENYSPEKKLGAIAVMYKVTGYNAEGGDWFWARYLATGKIDAEGKLPKCINCHGDAKNNGYVMNHPLK